LPEGRKTEGKKKNWCVKRFLNIFFTGRIKGGKKNRDRMLRKRVRMLHQSSINGGRNIRANTRKKKGELKKKKAVKGKVLECQTDEGGD